MWHNVQTNAGTVFTPAVSVRAAACARQGTGVIMSDCISEVVGVVDLHHGLSYGDIVVFSILQVYQLRRSC